MQSAGTRSNSRSLLLMTFSCELTIDILAITLPIFALSLSASPFEIGLLATARGIAYGLFTFISGYISDRLDRKMMLAFSMLISGVVSLLFFFSTISFQLVILCLFQGLAMAMFWPAMEALVAEDHSQSIPQSLRSFNMSWAIGAMVGPLIGGGLITFLGVRSPFPIVIAVSGVNFMVIMRYGPRKNRIREKVVDSSKDRLPKSIISAALLLGALTAIFLAFFPAFGIQRGISAFEIGVLLFFFGVSRTVVFFRTPTTRMSLGSSLALASLGFFLVFLGNRPTIYLGTIITASATSILFVHSLERFLNGKDETRGRRAGMFEGSAGIGAVLGSFFAGIVADLSLSYAFLTAMVIGLVFALILERAKTKG